MASTKRDDKISYSRTSLEELYAKTSLGGFKHQLEQQRSFHAQVRASEVDLERDMPSQENYLPD